MTMPRWIVLALVGTLTGIAAAGESGDDLKAMQGRWVVTITEVDGKPASKELMKLKMLLVVEKDRFRVLTDDEVLSGGTLKLDSGKKPRALDAMLTEGPVKGVVQKAIYEIKGDTMTAVFAKPGAPRPTEFKTKEGTEQTLVRYERLKK